MSVNAPPPFAAIPRDLTKPHYCSGCGHQLVVIEERSPIFDRTTGERPVERWLQCPRYERSWRNVWMGGICHDSLGADNALSAREWR